MTFFVNPFPQTFDANGDPTAQFNAFFGEPNQDPKLFPKAPFSDAALTVPLATTLILDNRGSFGIDIFLDGEYSYRVEDSLGALYRSSPAIIGISSAVIRTDEQVGGNAIVAHESLVCSNPTVSTIDIDATAVTLKDSNNFSIRASNINLTINITVSGENGLDTGAEAADTFYHYFVIFNPTTSTTSGLFSLSPTAPALPLGFTFFGLVGAVYNDSGSDFIDMLQEGNIVVREELFVLTNGNDTAITAIDLSAGIPVTAKEALFSIALDNNGVDVVSQAIITATNATTFTVAAMQNPGASAANRRIQYTESIQVHEAQTIYYRVVTGTSNLNLTLNGWTF